MRQLHRRRSPLPQYHQHLVAGLRLGWREGGKLAPLGRLKAEDDGLLGNASGHERLSSAIRSPVMLDPDLAVDDVDMQHTAVHPPATVPAHVYDYVVIARGINNGLCVNAPVGRTVCRQLSDERAHCRPVLL